MNPADILLIILIAAVLVWAVVSIVRRRKKGGCSCGCEGCTGRRDGCPAGMRPPDSGEQA
ncbi:MAG: FeoB-associated Cys-rich membrane protein [Lachnospiraceae bacterium]|nr:FeoB-associated Cys-rich membrane protein [Lachnospiraceae bacterium]MBP5255413.1 FeoB-associated Cys-rich membrane protein [Lachnospiraceae bacterium]